MQPMYTLQCVQMYVGETHIDLVAVTIVRKHLHLSVMQPRIQEQNNRYTAGLTQYVSKYAHRKM